MGSSIDIRLLCRGEAPVVANYLRELAVQQTNNAISNDLLTHVKDEAIPPRTLSIWLSVCRDNSAIITFLRQDISRVGRQIAIKNFCKKLRRDDGIWHAVGAAAGLVHLLSTFPVMDVKLFCRVLGLCCRPKKDRQRVSQRASELLNALATPSAVAAGDTEDRPLLQEYKRLLPACDVATRQLWSAEDFRPRFELDAETTLPGFSLWMGETLELLESVEPTLYDESQSMMPKNERLVLALLSALSKRSSRCRPDDVLRIVRLAVHWFRNSRPMQIAYESEHCMLDPLIRIWSRSTTAMTPELASVLPYFEIYPQALARYLKSIPFHLRMDLLRLVLRHAEDNDANLDSDEDMRKNNLEWSSRTFVALGAAGLPLLERLTQLYGKLDFIDNATSVKQADDEYREFVDCDAAGVRLVMRRTMPGNEQEAVALIEQQKQQSQRSKEPTARAKSARTALKYAMCSGSLQLVRDTFRWARRFDKDALTVRHIYQACDEQLVSLMSAIPIDLRKSMPSRVQLLDNAILGNEIIFDLVAAACDAINEPSFQHDDWKNVLALLSKVVMLRMQRAPAYKKASGMTDADLYTTLWQDTLTSLVRLEKLLLEDRHSPLVKDSDWHSSLRIRQLYFQAEDVVTPQVFIPATARFIDELARARDDLWKEVRMKHNPEVLSLQWPWPQGLALQMLLPFRLHPDIVIKELTYILQRAQLLVFVEKRLVDKVIPQSAETQNAVGPFVDSYRIALNFWIQGAEHQARPQRISEALQYAIENLSSHLPPGSSRRYWTSVMDQVLKNRPASPLVQQAWQNDIAALPTDDPVTPTEWNPAGYTDEEVSPELTVLEAILHCDDEAMPTTEAPFSIDRPTGSAYSSLIDRYDDCCVASAGQDAVTAMLLLYVESQRCADCMLLRVPFPSVAEPRFPAVFLDLDFLEQTKSDDNVVKTAVKLLAQQTAAPPTLVLRLLEKMLSMSPKDARTEVEAFRLVRSLSYGDRPATALDAVKKIVLDYPEHSAWHRQILTSTLLRRLSPLTIEDFLFSLFLEASRRHTREVDAPAIKITTLKHLQALVSGPEYLSPSSALRLAQRLSNNSHVDVRVASVKSMTAILVTAPNEGSQSGVQHEILSFLEELVPVASAINETIGPSSAASLDDLPSYSVLAPTPPTMSSLLDTALQLKRAGKDELRITFIDRVLITMLEVSIETNRKWTQAFLRLLGVPIEALPDVPAYPHFVISLLLQHRDVLPLEVLDVARVYLKATMKPPQSIQAVNELLESCSLQYTAAGKYWLAIWGTAKHQYAQEIFATLRREQNNIHIRLQHLQDFWWDLIKLTVDQGAWTLLQHSHSTRLLEPPIKESGEQIVLWCKNVKPLLVRLVEYVSSLRTTEWQKNPDRRPAALPDTEGLELRLLPYPQMSWEATATTVQQRSENLATEITARLEKLLLSGRPYHNSFAKLKEALLKMTPSKYDLHVALPLGRTSSHERPSMLKCLRVELAYELIHADTTSHKLASRSTRTDILCMLERWKASTAEEFRTWSQDLYEDLEPLWKKFPPGPDLSLNKAKTSIGIGKPQDSIDLLRLSVDHGSIHGTHHRQGYLQHNTAQRLIRQRQCYLQHSTVRH